jgi:hypothetical protein
VQRVLLAEATAVVGLAVAVGHLGQVDRRLGGPLAEQHPILTVASVPDQCWSSLRLIG